jgi:Protein of unknown function (DUF664)
VLVQDTGLEYLGWKPCLGACSWDGLRWLARRGGCPAFWPPAQYLPGKAGPRAAGDDGPVGISVDTLISYVDRAVDAMSGIVSELGDELANERPSLPGTNSPYAILRHCLGVMEFWGGQVVAGCPVRRDRDAEFRAAGPCAGLIAAAGEAKRQFQADASAADPGAPPRGSHPGMRQGELEVLTQGHALVHVMEEICQHLGQMELTRDILRAS